MSIQSSNVYRWSKESDKKIKRAENKKLTYGEYYERFITSRKVLGVSEATINFYKWNLKALNLYLVNNGIHYINSITKEDIDDFIVNLQEIYENKITIHTYLRATRTFLKYAMESEYVPKFNIRLIKLERHIKEVYNDDEIIKLLKKPDLKKCSFSEYRDWVMVQYFLETGNRLNSVINIKVEDVGFPEHIVKLRKTKNRKQMFSPIAESFSKVLYEYIETWKLNREDYLFPNFERKQLTRNAIQNAISRYNKRRGVEKTSIHAFRHTFAKNYIIKGGNAFKLQLLLGHSGMEITRQYVNLYGNDLTNDFEKFSIIDEYSHKSRIKRK
ncbi:MAG: site-specific integrase [Dehalobacter sp. 4CP]|uniref:tyrosine-type recombinase/integrase n=1 Tax=Dehalobacter sp. CP TaxID=2594474 RepID=UPI0013C8D7D1|nr:tyrosine-type recombinase/integrase [Dehalobacter sp.]NBJ16028.1 site-specific integrase [Dehalobacter sp. 4CP]